MKEALELLRRVYSMLDDKLLYTELSVDEKKLLNETRDFLEKNK